MTVRQLSPTRPGASDPAAPHPSVLTLRAPPLCDSAASGAGKCVHGVDVLPECLAYPEENYPGHCCQLAYALGMQGLIADGTHARAFVLGPVSVSVCSQLASLCAHRTANCRRHDHGRHVR
jgi:hypothetical protein